jgi:hypothetical protein
MATSDGASSGLVTTFNGERFSTPERVLTTKNPFSTPCIAFNPEGRKLLVWSERISLRWQIRGSHDMAGAFSEPQTLVEVKRDAKAPSIATDALGSFWLAYEEQEKFGVRVRVTEINL